MNLAELTHKRTQLKMELARVERDIQKAINEPVFAKEYAYCDAVRIGLIKAPTHS